MIHSILIAVVIIAIVCLQIYVFVDNVLKLEKFKCVFPNDDNDYDVVKDDAQTFVGGISGPSENKIFSVIIESINKYLKNNKGAVSDYHLMKDIVDRNCDAAEEEINTQIPIPLYLGLMGTMIGILVGVGYLVLSGGLDALLNASGIKSGSDGVQTLLGGVALAMISSIIGIIFTTIGSSLVKNSKAQVERNKNTFLSWMQAKLLPQLSSDAAGALAMMTQNLSEFNNTFSENTENLKHTLEGVSTASESQAQLLEELNKMKIARIAKANIDVYDKLQNCTDEIEKLGEYLKNTEEYLKNVKELNSKLGEAEERTKRIDKMAEFFETEITQINERKKIMKDATDSIDDALKQAINKMKESTEGQTKIFQDALNDQQDALNKRKGIMKDSTDSIDDALKQAIENMKESTVAQTKKFQDALDDQQTAMQGKLSETTKLIDELKNLTAVKDSMEKMAEATSNQSTKFKELTDEIKKLAEIKVSGGKIEVLSSEMKIFLYSVGGVVALSGIVVIIKTIIELF